MDEPKTTLQLIDEYFQKLAELSKAEHPEKAFRPRVLVIDDDEDFCHACRHTFGAEGITVDTALNGVVGCRKAMQGEPYDLILLDLKMPGMNGIETFRRLRREWEKSNCPGSPIVLCTGHARDSDMDEAMTLGGYFGFLVKPFDVAKLAQVFRHYRLLKD